MSTTFYLILEEKKFQSNSSTRVIKVTGVWRLENAAMSASFAGPLKKWQNASVAAKYQGIMSDSTSIQRKAVIIGAGPAGLTAAYELVTRVGIQPIILEQDDCVGGLARTINYKGNRMDIGGHRFFSKCDRVMDWWLKVMPLQSLDSSQLSITYRGSLRDICTEGNGPDPQQTDRVMLVRKRKSRIFFLRRFFDYPISLNLQTLANLGLIRTIKIGFSYLKALLFQIKPENNLEQFFVNRFGRVLYETFFESYTEKVWGIPCSGIAASWGAQRVKGLSIKKAIIHALKKFLPKTDIIRQKDTETSLIEQFLYPKLGPGQMWEVVTEEVVRRGGIVHLQQKVTGINYDGEKIISVETTDPLGNRTIHEGDIFFSTMPIKDLISSIKAELPSYVREIASGLVYRDFITVGLLVSKLSLKNQNKNSDQLSDNWIYIQEPDVKLGRLQIFNNWSPYLVEDPDKVWLGLEYFCNESDELWQRSADDMLAFAKAELHKIGLIDQNNVLDGTVVHVPKTYPGYFGTYDRLSSLTAYLDRIENLFLIGRNGMHKYNNQDHSMLAAMTAVDNIQAGTFRKDNLWSINIEDEYHEEKSS